MFGKRQGDLSPWDLGQLSHPSRHAPMSLTPATSPQDYAARSNAASQYRSPSAQDPGYRARLEHAYTGVKFPGTADDSESPGSYPDLYVPKRPTFPKEREATFSQTVSPPRSEGYHLALPESATSPGFSVTSSYSQEAGSFGRSTQERNLSKNLPPLPAQGPPSQRSSKPRVAPPRPPRSPGIYDFDSFLPPNLCSTSPPFVLPYGVGPYIESADASASPAPSQISTPRFFDVAQSLHTPQLVSTFASGEHRLIHLTKPETSSPKPEKKLGFFGRALRKFSDHKESNPDLAREAKSESPKYSTPFFGPGAPNPTRGRAFTQPHPQHFDQNWTYPSETGTGEIRAPNTQKLFFGNPDRSVALTADPAANHWKARTFESPQLRTRRVFTTPEVVLEDAGEDRLPLNQYQAPRATASQLTKPKGAQLRGLGIRQDPPRPFSWQIQNPEDDSDSKETLISKISDTKIHQSPEDRFFSVVPRNHNRGKGKGVEGAEDRVESAVPTSENKRSSPIPSIFFENLGKEEYSRPPSNRGLASRQGEDSRHLPHEVDLSLSYPESIVGDRSPEKPPIDRFPPRSFEDLPVDSPKTDAYKQAYYSLFGSRPTKSVLGRWEAKPRDLALEEAAGKRTTGGESISDEAVDEAEACDLNSLESGENFVSLNSASPVEHFEEDSPSCGRGRLRRKQFVSEEDIPEEEECSVTNRRAIAERRRLERINRQLCIAAPVDRQVPSNATEVEQEFSVAKGGEGGEAAEAGEGGEGVEVRSTRHNTFLNHRDRRKKFISDLKKEETSEADKHLERISQPKSQGKSLVKNIGGVKNQSEIREERDEDLVVSAATRPIKQLANSSRHPSPRLEGEDFLVCVRSKTGTVKEVPITPENKAKIKSVLQQDAGCPPSVYSSGDQSPGLSTVAELCVTPLLYRKKGPQTPASEESSHIFPSFGQADPFHSTRAFLNSCLPETEGPCSFSNSEEESNPTMETLQVSSALRSSTKSKAEDDARVMQKSVIESCKKAGRDPPKYVLLELIGKGSFGRVYKGQVHSLSLRVMDADCAMNYSKDINTTQIVAVKIIDIDESDTLNPRLADTYSDFMKEVNALKILSESRAKNINHVIEALPVGTAMWMITEYCGGGSIATLIKPTPGGLKEKFIVPILREVAEAVKWVHQAGIIHRDLKCANVLITEEGGVQLCDFGVAGITETALDKRSTFIGTPHWMAPELFRGSQYGKEVDIWAFGSMTYEMATGLPPSARSGVTGMELGAYLETHLPRLDGDLYSEGLKSIVAFCLEEKPSDRPTIEAVQRHGYIHNTNAKYPSSGLSDLVKAFKLWESTGGSRNSLFATGGAQGPSELSSTALSDDDWNFSTTPAFDLAVAQASNPEDIINVYGASAAVGQDFIGDETSRPIRQPQARPARRRPPPEALAPLKAPLEKIFDPNTMSNYKENSINHFNLQPSHASDLPLRDDSAQTSIRDTLIDLDAHDIPSGPSSFSEMDTMKPSRRIIQDESEDYEYGSGPDFTRSALSDPVNNPNNRRTQDWKFPSMAPPASASSEFTRFPVLQRPNVTPASGARPALHHHPTEPYSLPTQNSQSLVPPAPGSDRMSLIDLDMSIPEPSRPSTADSAASQDNASANPFMWERHASVYNAHGHRPAREPSLYLEDSIPSQPRTGNTLQDFSETSDFSASDAEGYPDERFNGYRSRGAGQGEEGFYDHQVTGNVQGESSHSRREYRENAARNRAGRNGTSSSSTSYSAAHFHPLPLPPSAAVLSGTADNSEMHAESDRMFNTLRSSLETFREAYENMPTRPPKNSQSTSGDDASGSSSSMHEMGPNMS